MRHHTSLLVASCSVAVAAFLRDQPTRLARPSRSKSSETLFTSQSKDEWSVADDWNDLSSLNPQNSGLEGRDIFYQDLAGRAAYEMQKGSTSVLSEEDRWMQDVIEHIQEPEIDALEDISTHSDTLHKEDFIEEMGREISYLVRCNESPHEMLVTEGRALPPLTEEERDDPKQLVIMTDEGEWEATPFLQQAVKIMFQEHCTPSASKSEESMLVLSPAGVAAWMSKILGKPKSVGMFDRRVTALLALHGPYGKGYLTLQDFQNMYLKNIVGEIRPKNTLNTFATTKHLRARKEQIKRVWDEIRKHGILSPAEQGRAELLFHLNAQDSGLKISVDENADNLLDECLILDESSSFSDISKTTDREGIASHETVELASDKKTPIWLRDGQFVFIDEESCIGCMQCTAAAPASFRMVENGRARTFAQRNSPEVAIAVSTCPVDCMHFVSFDELTELEDARDHGDGRDDHRHFGHSPTRGYIGRIPLYVSGMDSDAKHRSSWYHYLKNKCQVSTQCPQRGCFDCPRYAEPGDNPYFQERLQKANHVRAQYFIDKGFANSYRKTADL